MNSAIAINPHAALLKRLIDAAINRAPGSDGNIISNHLQQIEDLVIGQGVDFQPEQDEAGDRTQFVQQFVEQTKIRQFLPDILRKTMGAGEVLLWLRYTPKGYRLRYFTADQFEPFYDPVTDDLYAAVVVTHYTQKTVQGPRQKWIKLVILQQGYFTQTSDYRPEVTGLGSDRNWTPEAAMDMQKLQQTRTLAKDEITFTENPFPFLPIRICYNKPIGPGQRAADDFTEFASQLITHDDLAGVLRKNTRKFARQTIVTNLNREQIIKKRGFGGSFSGAAASYGSSATFASDYYDAQQMAAYHQARFGVSEGDEEVADIIGVQGMEDEYFLDVLDWRPLQGAQLEYLGELERRIHSAMGSSRERGGNTAYETRVNLSWATATANKKAYNVLTKGLCMIIADAIEFEESLFQTTRGGLGLIPAGDRTVRWRRIDLIEPTPQEQLQTSILGRNLEEEGVGTREILKLLFPSKTEKEIQALTGGSGGVPFRKIDKTVPKILELVQAASGLGQAGTPLLDVADLLLQNLMEAIQYGREQPYDLDGGSRSTIAGYAARNDAAAAGVDALVSAAAASTDAERPGMVSADDQSPTGGDGVEPSTGTATGNPLTAAFGKFTDTKQSPILRALDRLTGRPKSE